MVCFCPYFPINIIQEAFFDACVKLNPLHRPPCVAFKHFVLHNSKVLSLTENDFHTVLLSIVFLLMVSIREPVILIQRYSIPSPSLSVFLPIDGKY
jgi:hypothetical protein